VETTKAYIAGNENISKSTIFTLREDYRPFVYHVPPKSEGPLLAKPYDPLEQKITIAISNRAGELTLGKPNTMRLYNEEVKDFSSNERFLSMKNKYTMERMQEVPLADFETLYSGIPRIVGTSVGQQSPFPGVIRGITNNEVILYFSARPDATVPTVLGSKPIHELDADNFEVNMEAQLGELVQRVGGLPGRITSVDADQFTIDFGQTFAGETLSCEVTTQLVKPDEKKKIPKVQWITDYRQGLSQARRTNKKVLLLLTSDDICPDCATMEQRLLLDPSLDDLRDRFILVKVNGNKQEQLAELFGRQGYPLTLILDGMGKELARLSGEQHIATIAYRLDQVLGKGKQG
jgi:hypothetical protein